MDTNSMSRDKTPHFRSGQRSLVTAKHGLIFLGGKVSNTTISTLTTMPAKTRTLKTFETIDETPTPTRNGIEVLMTLPFRHWLPSQSGSWIDYRGHAVTDATWSVTVPTRHRWSALKTATASSFSSAQCGCVDDDTASSCPMVLKDGTVPPSCDAIRGAVALTLVSSCASLESSSHFTFAGRVDIADPFEHIPDGADLQACRNLVGAAVNKRIRRDHQDVVGNIGLLVAMKWSRFESKQGGMVGHVVLVVAHRSDPTMMWNVTVTDVEDHNTLNRDVYMNNMRALVDCGALPNGVKTTITNVPVTKQKSSECEAAATLFGRLIAAGMDPECMSCYFQVERALALDAMSAATKSMTSCAGKIALNVLGSDRNTILMATDKLENGAGPLTSTEQKLVDAALEASPSVPLSANEQKLLVHLQSALAAVKLGNVSSPESSTPKPLVHLI
jgi:hypothetical protein